MDKEDSETQKIKRISKIGDKIKIRETSGQIGKLDSTELHIN